MSWSELLRRGRDVAIYGRGELTPEARFVLGPAAASIPLEVGSVEDLPRVMATVKRLRPEAIVHAAGSVDTGGLFGNPYLASRAILDGTLNVFEAARPVRRPTGGLHVLHRCPPDGPVPAHRCGPPAGPATGRPGQRRVRGREGGRRALRLRLWPGLRPRRADDPPVRGLWVRHALAFGQLHEAVRRACRQRRAGAPESWRTPAAGLHPRQRRGHPDRRGPRRARRGGPDLLRRDRRTTGDGRPGFADRHGAGPGRPDRDRRRPGRG